MPLFLYSLLVYLGQREQAIAEAEQNFRAHLLSLGLFGIALAAVGELTISRPFLRWAERLQGNADCLNAGDAALKSGQDHLGLALEGGSLGVWEWSMPLGVTNGNPQLARILGYQPDESRFDMETWKQAIHPDDRPMVRTVLERYLAGETQLYECEYRMRHKDGRWIWLLVHGRVVEKDRDGKPLRMAGTVLDITNRKATEQQLRQRTEELVALVEAMPALVWIARDPQCRNIVGNRAADELYGVRDGIEGSKKKTAGANTEQGVRYYGLDGREYAVEEMPMQRAAAEGRLLQGVQVEVRSPDGKGLWLFGNATPLFDDQGSVRGALGAFVDITQFKATEADLCRHRDHLESLVAERTYELAVAKEAAERANRTKSKFLAKVSHELRTPLNSLMVLAHTLADDNWGNLMPQQIEYARMIELSGNDLGRLIDGLLDLSRIETGKVDIQVQPTPFPDLMQSLRQIHRYVAGHKGLHFKMEIDADVPAAIVTDPSRLKQLLSNLLSNAIKFTRQGGVTLHIRRAVSGWRYNNPALASADMVIAFDVIDTGIGMDPVQREQILGALQPPNSEGGEVRDGGSPGLGLTISREIAILLGGELGLASLPGQGSTFTIYLPLVYAGPVVPAAESAAAVAPNAGADPVLAGKTVLVVDDDQFSRQTVGVMLEKQGMQVLAAASGAEALEILSQNMAVDAVFMDIIMPAMDGYQTTRIIRASLGRRTLPIIALTANIEPGSREASLAAGCSDHLSKPAGKADLLDCLYRWLEHSPAEYEM